MTIFDFDRNIQKKLNKAYAEIKPIDWKKWLKITSPQEFEEYCLKNS
jgi:hypothetical protein